MKFTIDRVRFSEALTWAARALPKKSPVPIITGIMLTAEAETLTLFASNYEVTHKLTIPAEVAADGQVLVLGSLARDLVHALRGNTVDVVAEGSTLHLSAGRSSYKLPLMPVEEYPSLPVFPETVGSIEQVDLARIIDVVKPVVDIKNVVEELQGISLEGAEGEVRATATDRFVISTATAPWVEEAGFAATIPLMGAASAVAGMTGTVTVGHNGNLFGLADDTHQVTMRVVAAEYPNWRVALRDGDDVTVTVNAGDLADAVKRASLALPTAQSPVILLITNDAIEIRTSTAESADGVEIVEAEADGETTVSVAASFLTSCLATIPTPEAQLGLHHKQPPIMLTPVGDDSLLHVVMPRRVVGA